MNAPISIHLWVDFYVLWSIVIHSSPINAVCINVSYLTELEKLISAFCIWEPDFLPPDYWTVAGRSKKTGFPPSPKGNGHPYFHANSRLSVSALQRRALKEYRKMYLSPLEIWKRDLLFEGAISEHTIGGWGIKQCTRKYISYCI